MPASSFVRAVHPERARDGKMSIFYPLCAGNDNHYEQRRTEENQLFVKVFKLLLVIYIYIEKSAYCSDESTK